MSVEIQGDMLAMDGNLCRTIRSRADALQTRFPGHQMNLIARIAEEFDHLNGHRVRFELRTAVADHQQILVREARKTAEDAITAAFAELKKKFRQATLRRGDEDRPPAPSTSTQASSAQSRYARPELAGSPVG